MADSSVLTQDIVKNSHTICLEKFAIVQTAFGTGDAEIQLMKTDIDRVFTGLGNPVIWVRPLAYDPNALTQVDDTLQQMDASNLVGIVLEIRKMLDILGKYVPILTDDGFESFNPATAAADPVVNRMVLDALLGVQRKVIAQLRVFGSPLASDGEFKQMVERQKPILQTYNTQLESGALAAKLTDRDEVAAQGDKIGGAADIPAFKQQFDQFTTLIQGKIPVA